MHITLRDTVVRPDGWNKTRLSLEYTDFSENTSVTFAFGKTFANDKPDTAKLTVTITRNDITFNSDSYQFLIDGHVVSEGTTLFTAPKYFNFIGPHLHYKICGDEITVYADAYARYVEIDSPDSDFILSDNYFDMNAGKKTVKILEGEAKSFVLRSVYDIC